MTLLVPTIKKLLLTYRVKLNKSHNYVHQVFSVITVNGILNAEVQYMRKGLLRREHLHFSVKDGKKYLEITAGKVVVNSR